MAGAIAAVFVVLAAALVVITSMYLQADSARADAIAAQEAEAEQRRLAQEREQQARQREAEAADARGDEVAQRQAAQAAARRAQQMTDLLRDIRDSVGLESPAVLDALDRSAERIEEDLADQPDILAYMRYAVAGAYRDFGYEERAGALLRVALAHDLEPADVLSVELAETLYGLGAEPWDDPEIQVALLSKALATYRKHFGDEARPEIMDTLTVLGRALIGHDRLEEAESTLREAIALGERLGDQSDRWGSEKYDSLADLVHDRGDDEEAERLYRQALAVARASSQPGDRNELAWASQRLGGFLRQRGELEEAAEHYREAYELPRDRRDEDDLWCTVKLAEVLHELGDDERAEAVVERLLELCRTVPGHTDGVMPGVVADGAALCEAMGRLDLAESLRAEHLDRCREELGVRHVATLDAMKALGWHYFQTDRAGPAAPLLAEALEGSRGLEDPNYGSINRCAIRLARVLHELDDEPGADDVLEANVEFFRTALPADHWIIGRSVSDAGWQYYNVARIERADAIFVEHLEWCRKELGADQPRTINALHMIGGFYTKTNRHDLAVPLLAEVMAATANGVELDDHALVDALGCLQFSLNALRRTTEARRAGAELIALRADLAARPDATPDDHNGYAWLLLTIEPEDLRDPPTALPAAQVAVARTDRKHPGHLDTLAIAHDRMGDLDIAIEIEREALLLPQSAWSDLRGRLADFLERRSDPEAAERVFLDDVAAARAESPEDRAGLSSLLILGARRLLAHDKPAEAEPLMRECLTIRRQELAPGHWLTGNAMSVLGEALTGQGKFEEAEPLLVEGYERIRARAWQVPYTVHDVRREESIQRLIDLYHAWGKPEQAGRWRSTLAELRPATAETEMDA
jgi:tetratricopeptide (TPR) repeat protein